MIFGRTDLRKGVSEAKFDGQADFDVKNSLAPPNSAEKHEKPKTKKRKKIVKILFDSESKKKNRKQNFRSKKIRDFFSVFRDFRLILEEQGFFGRENQLAHQILLQMHLS